VRLSETGFKAVSVFVVFPAALKEQITLKLAFRVGKWYVSQR
jgi:hypothetical protein